MKLKIEIDEEKVVQVFVDKTQIGVIQSLNLHADLKNLTCDLVLVKLKSAKEYEELLKQFPWVSVSWVAPPAHVPNPDIAKALAASEKLYHSFRAQGIPFQSVAVGNVGESESPALYVYVHKTSDMARIPDSYDGFPVFARAIGQVRPAGE